MLKMKKKILFLGVVAMLFSKCVISQETISKGIDLNYLSGENSTYLSLNGTSDGSSYMNFRNSSGFWHLSGPRSYENNSPFSIFWNNGTDFTRIFNILNNGRVGIGTSNPYGALDINTNKNDSPYSLVISNNETNYKGYHLYVKSVSGNAYEEAFRLGLKYYETSEKNGFISFYRGGNSSGGAIGISTNEEERLRIDKDGNVGIGTTSPKAMFHVNGGLRARVSQFSTVNGTSDNSWLRDSWLTSNNANIGWDSEAKSWKRDSGAYNDFGGIIWQDEGTYFVNEARGSKLEYTNSEFLDTAFLFASINTKNIGVGTNNPTMKLDLQGLGSSDGIRLGNIGKIRGSVAGSNHFVIENTTSDGNTYLRSSSSGKLVLNDQGGNVGIGTTNPQNKLSVKGVIWAEEVQVSLSDGADWVFEDDYELRSLNEVETFIKENKHLPEIPSAEDFRNNDLKLSEMTNKLLQKIEELTLYTIEQEKQIKEQKELIKTQKIKEKSFEERLAKLEALLQ